MNRYLASALLLLAVFVAWQLVASLASVDDILLASPTEALGAMWEDSGFARRGLGVTAVEIVLGLLSDRPGAGVARWPCTCGAPSAMPRTRCWWPPRRSPSSCWRPSSSWPSTTASGPSWPSWRWSASSRWR